MLRIIYGVILGFIIIAYFIVIKRQNDIFKTKQIKFSDGYKLKIISDKNLELYENNSLVDTIKKAKGNYFIYYLIGEKGYYIFNLLTKKNRFYNEKSIPIKEIRKINKLLKLPKH